MCADGNPHARVPCKKNVSCKHQGLADVKAHCAGRAHLSFEKAVKSTRKLDAMMSSSSSSSSLTELFHTNFRVHHNLSLLTAERLSPLYAKMFLILKLRKSLNVAEKNPLVF